MKTFKQHLEEGSRSSNRLIRKLGGERKANKDTTVTDTKLSAKLKDSSDRFINHPSHTFQRPEQDARANYAHSIGIHHVPGMDYHLDLINKGEPREDSYLYSVDHIRSIRGAQSAGKLEKLRIKNDIRAGTRQPNEQRPAVYAGATSFKSIAPAYRHSDFGPGGIEGENDSRTEVGLPELPARMSRKAGQPRLDATDSRLLSPDMGRSLDVIEKMKKLEPERFARIQTDRLNRDKQLQLQYPDTPAEADKRMDDYLNSGLGGGDHDEDEDFDGRAKEAMKNYKVAIMAHLRGSPEILSHEAEVPMEKGEEWKGETPMLPDIFRTRFRSRRPKNMQENITATNWTQQITEAYRMILEAIDRREAKEAPAHHKDPHYMAIVQHNAKMHEFVGGGGEVTKEHIDAAKQIISTAHESGHSGFKHGGYSGSDAGKIGIWHEYYDIHSANPGGEPVHYFEPITHRTHSSWFDKKH